MAKDGDIIDVLFGWIISFFGWLLGLVVKLAIAIVGGLFTLIISLFKKEKAHDDKRVDQPLAEE